MPAEQENTNKKEPTALGRAWQGFKHIQRDQPSFWAEMRASVRQSREDLLGTLFGPLMGNTREMGAPGTPTPQQITEGLEPEKGVDKKTDRIAPAKQQEAAKENTPKEQTPQREFLNEIGREPSVDAGAGRSGRSMEMER